MFDRRRHEALVFIAKERGLADQMFGFGRARLRRLECPLKSRATLPGQLPLGACTRLVVVEGDKSDLDIPFGELRRIQFDIERGRDATIVIVPEHIHNWPRVVSVRVPRLKDSAVVLARIGERMNEPAEVQTG